jgi:diadenylate cyclase
VLKSLIDIALVLLILVQLFRMLRGTKGIYLLNGIVVLFIVYTFSIAAGLPYFSFILSGLMLVMIVALPILFQSELKHGLELLGRRNPLIRRLLNSPTIAPEGITIVSEAVEHLARTRTGALIVFEREDPLFAAGESGSTIDALLSRILLEQIFYPNSPLHDGAVIVKGDRIRAAGCFLPLDTQLQLPQKLGSRHRAGLSLATQTDAVVVIISEETGAISLAAGGTLDTNLAVADLTLRLRGLLRLAKPASPGTPVAGEKQP